jgi:hypothetical protein
MKTKHPKKMRLGRETLARLGNQDLREVAGATKSCDGDTCITCICTQPQVCQTVNTCGC